MEMTSIIADQVAAAEALATDIERLAAFIRTNPDIANQLTSQHFLLGLSHADNPREALAHYVRRALAAGATVEKNFGERYSGAYLKFGSVVLDAYAQREQVCERVVVGTREVEVEEADPVAVAALPKVKRVEVVEDVEWQCHPILAADEQPVGGVR